MHHRIILMNVSDTNFKLVICFIKYLYSVPRNFVFLVKTMFEIDHM